MKKQLILITMTFLLASCGSKESIENNTSSNISYDWTINFVTNGGSEVSPIYVKDGETVSKPTNPTKNGYIFQDWFVDTYLTISFDWNTQITSDWTLYASWKEDENKQISSEEEQHSSSEKDSTNSENESSSQEKTSAGYGPNGSTLTNWYLVGSGSLWDSNTGWTVTGGIQLYTNPANSNDKGCILGLALEAGDKFKVTNGDSIWFGYEGVDKSSSPSNKGLTNFTADSDGYGGQNFKCTISGIYDMYINSTGTFWIQSAN